MLCQVRGLGRRPSGSARRRKWRHTRRPPSTRFLMRSASASIPEALLGVLRGVRGAGDRLGRFIVKARSLSGRRSRKQSSAGCGGSSMPLPRDRSAPSRCGTSMSNRSLDIGISSSELPDRQSVDELCRSLSLRSARILIVGMRRRQRGAIPGASGIPGDRLRPLRRHGDARARTDDRQGRNRWPTFCRRI